ncbi:hypothetical protein HHK36_025500 [Tetracentron sinense]|uniref:Transmembrane 9 superfamily member n=1 Tax=Tetracentron sinense TaxID=13715 RepID=A0A834YIS7_TETSI|nr:hypothetical protein HHK36_025500 [Tetracentron sinense]
MEDVLHRQLAEKDSHVALLAQKRWSTMSAEVEDVSSGEGVAIRRLPRGEDDRASQDEDMLRSPRVRPTPHGKRLSSPNSKRRQIKFGSPSHPAAGASFSGNFGSSIPERGVAGKEGRDCGAPGGQDITGMGLSQSEAKLVQPDITVTSRPLSRQAYPSKTLAHSPFPRSGATGLPHIEGLWADPIHLVETIEFVPDSQYYKADDASQLEYASSLFSPFLSLSLSLQLSKMGSYGWIGTLFFALLLIHSTHSFYLPGVAPRDFHKSHGYLVSSQGDPLQVKVNKLSSTKTQLPYDYYFLNYCKPPKIMNNAENLGEVLRGDRIENSVYTFLMEEEQSCKVACRMKLNAGSAKNFKEKIDDEYRVNMILDNLPVAVLRQRRDGSKLTTYEHGFRVGFKGNYAGRKDEKYFINNHLSFRVMYHKDSETDLARIVGFEVTPNRLVALQSNLKSLLLCCTNLHVLVYIALFCVNAFELNVIACSFILGTFSMICQMVTSLFLFLSSRLALANSIKHEYKVWNEKNPQLVTCNPSTKVIIQGSTVPQEVDADKEVIFTYDVSFKESEIKWASRWDTYLLMNDDQIHWFSIINSLMIVLFLSGMVAMITMRTLYRDIANYNQLETQDEAQEETGWKLVHGDVFRAPINSSLLCVYVGTGVQIFGMTLVTMIFALLGFLSPSNRGGLMTAMVLLWVFMGLLAGYSSARFYKMFKGAEWKKNTLKTAFMFPAILFAIFFVLNALIWGEKSSGAVPFGTMFALVFLWFGISVPLVFVGSYLGFKKPVIEDPVKTNKIPRQIPEQAWYMKPVFSVLIGGILPFGAVFIELFFILTSIWLNQFYYIFGFLFIVFVILLITCAEITIVLCYFQLCSEDYNWWWRAYLTAGSSALYLFLYSIFYFFTKLEITKLVSGILYFGYMLIVSYAFFVLTGTIGFYASFWFVRKIYSSVKID